MIVVPVLHVRGAFRCLGLKLDTWLVLALLSYVTQGNTHGVANCAYTACMSITHLQRQAYAHMGVSLTDKQTCSW